MGVQEETRVIPIALKEALVATEKLKFDQQNWELTIRFLGGLVTFKVFKAINLSNEISSLWFMNL